MRINTEVLKMNVFGGVEEKMPKIEKMLKLRKDTIKRRQRFMFYILFTKFSNVNIIQ